MSFDIDSRSRARAPVQQNITVYHVSKQLNVGHLVNIHEEGLMTIGSVDMQENAVYQMELKLSKPIAGMDKIPISADCLWTKKTDTGDQYWAGFLIVDIAEPDLNLLRLLLEQD